jgi:hypothetical protein
LHLLFNNYKIVEKAHIGGWRMEDDEGGGLLGFGARVLEK